MARRSLIPTSAGQPHPDPDDPMKTTPHPLTRGMTFMLLSVALFAINSLLLRGVSLHMPQAGGWTALLYRGVIGMVMVFALHGFGRGLSPLSFLNSRLVVLRGVVGAFSTATFYLSIGHLGASRAVVLSLTYPVFATLIAAWWLKERISRAALCWMLAGLGGLVLLLGGHADRTDPLWDLIALAGAVGAGFVVVLIRRLRDREHPGTIYGSLCFWCVLCALPMAGGEPLHLPMEGHVLLVGAAVIVGISQLLMTNAYRTMPVSRGSSVQMLLPLATSAGAWFLYDETFTAVEIAGAAMTLLATWRVARAR